ERSYKHFIGVLLCVIENPIKKPNIHLPSSRSPTYLPHRSPKSGDAQAPDSPDNYQNIRIYHRAFNPPYPCKDNQNGPGFLHTSHEEGREGRVRKEGRPPHRKILLPLHDARVRALRAL